MKTKSKKSYLISFCLTFVACLMAFAFTLGINKVNATNSSDLDATSINIASQAATTTYTQNGIKITSEASAEHQYRLVVANLNEVFASDNVLSVIVKTDIFGTNSRFTPILFDKYGNYYQGAGSEASLAPNGVNYEYKIATTLDELDTTTVSTVGGWSYFGWGKSNEWYWELKLDTMMWRFAPSNYGLEENVLSLVKGNNFEEVKKNNAIMSVGVMVGTANDKAVDMSLDAFYVRTTTGIYSLIDFTKLSLSNVAITETTTDEGANKVFTANVTDKLKAATAPTVSLTKEEGAFFDGVKLDVRQDAHYVAYGFRLDETGANTKYNGKFTDVESIIMQVRASNGIKVRPMIVDEYGRFTEAFGESGTWQYMVGTDVQNLTAKRDESKYSSIGGWGGIQLQEKYNYMEVPIDSFRVRARFQNFGGTTTADDITNFSKGADINVKLLSIINITTQTEGQIYIGDMYYRQTSGDVVKVGNAKDFTLFGAIDASVGNAIEFSTSTGTNAKITGQWAYYDECYTENLFGQNIVANEDFNYNDFQIALPQIKSTSCSVDKANADALISDYSGYEAFSYSINNFTKTDLTLDFYVQVRKVDGAWGADRYAGRNNTKALYVPDNGSKPFTYASNKVPAGFDGKVYIPLSGAGFGYLTRDELKIMTSQVFGKLDANVTLNFKLDNVKLVVDFPKTLINEETGEMFGLDGTYTLPKVSFTDKDGNVTESFYNGEAIVLPETVVAPEGQVFIGWENNGKIYPAGYQVEDISGDMSFTPKYVEFEMTKGASVRLDDPTGIRFQAKVANETYENLVATYGAENVKLGMRIIRGGTHYVDISVENYNVRDIDEVAVLVYNGVVANINADNYQVEYEGKAYIEITYADGTTSRIYAVANDNVRSIAEVAKSACEDPNTTLSQAQREKLEKYYK